VIGVRQNSERKTFDWLSNIFFVLNFVYNATQEPYSRRILYLENGQDDVGEVVAVGGQELVVSGVESAFPNFEVFGGHFDQVGSLVEQGVVGRLLRQVRQRLAKLFSQNLKHGNVKESFTRPVLLCVFHFSTLKIHRAKISNHTQLYNLIGFA
jgi:hypothetical protein